MNAVVFVCGRVFPGGHADGVTKSGESPFDDKEGLHTSNTPGIQYKVLGENEARCILVVVDNPVQYKEKVDFQKADSVKAYLGWVGETVGAVMREAKFGVEFPALKKVYVCSHFAGGFVYNKAKDTKDFQDRIKVLQDTDKSQDIQFPDIRVYNMSGTWQMPAFLYKDGLSVLNKAGELYEALDAAIDEYAKYCEWEGEYNDNLDTLCKLSIDRFSKMANYFASPKDSELKSSVIAIAVRAEDDAQLKDLLKPVCVGLKYRTDVRVVLVSPRGAFQLGADFRNANLESGDCGLKVDWLPSSDVIRDLRLELEGPADVYCLELANWKADDGDGKRGWNRFDAILAPWVQISSSHELFIYHARPDNKYVLEQMLTAACKGYSFKVGNSQCDVKEENELNNVLKLYYDEIMKGLRHG